jgi:hypothetical protein
VFVRVTNGISAIEAADNKIANQMSTNGWTLVEGTTDVYAYQEPLPAGESRLVFGSFKIDGAHSDLNVYKNEKINVVAYAVQKDTFGTAKGHTDAAIAEQVQKHFDLRPQAIIERWDLR